MELIGSPLADIAERAIAVVGDTRQQPISLYLHKH
jgi:hypothetical protein